MTNTCNNQTISHTDERRLIVNIDYLTNGSLRNVEGDSKDIGVGFAEVNEG
ncbi:hypothetical protein GCM10027190_44510 [Spirosoma areae]